MDLYWSWGLALGLAGWSARRGEGDQSVALTDKDEYAINELWSLWERHIPEGSPLSARVLDWRDWSDAVDIGAPDADRVDFVIGTDIAYYHYLIRPIIDTCRAHLPKLFSDGRKVRDGIVCIVGNANRKSQWDLYHSLLDGCYNQMTDELEPPWPGHTSMILYSLCLGKWCEGSRSDPAAPVDDMVPISVLLHKNNPELQVSFFGLEDHIANQEDEENQAISF